MYIDGPWAVPTYAADNPMPTYGIAPFPTGPAGSVSTVGGEDIVVARGGHHITDAEKFAEFLDSPYAQDAMAAQGDMSTEISDAKTEVKTTPYLQGVRAAAQDGEGPCGKCGLQPDGQLTGRTRSSEILAGKISVQRRPERGRRSQSNEALRGLAP